MSATRELARLSAYKTRLKQTIARRRLQLAEDAAQVARPLALLDRAAAVYRQISPIAALATLPLGALLKRIGFPRAAKATVLLRWLPLTATLVRASRFPGS